MNPKQREINEANELYAVLGGKMELENCRYLGKPPQKRRQTEAAEQSALMQWARLMEKQYPELTLLFAIPNGGSRNQLEAVNLKKQGVKAGVCDMCLPVARKGFHGLFVELKTQGGRVQDSQRWWIAQLNAQNYRATVCYGYDAAKAEIMQYLGIK